MAHSQKRYSKFMPIYFLRCAASATGRLRNSAPPPACIRRHAGDG